MEISMKVTNGIQANGIQANGINANPVSLLAWARELSAQPLVQAK